jgi:prolyl oligopeptidase
MSHQEERVRRMVVTLIQKLYSRPYGGFLLAMMFGLHVVGGEAEAPKNPPKTRTDNVRETIHGVPMTDPYRWLEDQDSPETRKWIEAQNAYTDAIVGLFPGKDALQKRLTELMRFDWTGMPLARNGRYFFAKREGSRELPVICIRRGLQGNDEVLIDPHLMSPDHSVSVELSGASEDGRLLAYFVRQGGEDETTPHLFDVDARKDLPETLPKARYLDFSLKPDKSGFYYCLHTSDGPRVYLHTMGDDPKQDKLIFGEGYGPDKGIGTSLSEDGRYLLMTVWHGSAGQKSEVYVQNLAANAPVKTIVNDIDARFRGSIGGNHLFLVTQWDAPKGRVFRVDLARPCREHWLEIIPESDAGIESLALAGGKLIVAYLRNVSSEVKVFEPDGSPVRDIPLPGTGSVGGFQGTWTKKETFFSFSSFHIPPAIYRCDILAEDHQLWSRCQVPIDSDNIRVKQIWYTSKDGTKIPMFILHSKGIRLDGNNPTLLRGYGGFNVSLTPEFSARAALWVESGGVFAVANLRGGGEFGEEWHKAGMFEKKQSVFDDFIAAAEYLIASGYTKPSKLAISGGSNGGLLVGAALIQRPELFRAVVCTYPLLDMVRYHKFLVAAFWVSEYGSSEDPEQFKYIYAYSPYHHVKSGTNYPCVLFITGDADTRVAPLHARKMAARLQAATGSPNPVLLRYDTTAGHSGGRPMSKQIEDMTDELSFLLEALGETYPPTSER